MPVSNDQGVHPPFRAFHVRLAAARFILLAASLLPGFVSPGRAGDLAEFSDGSLAEFAESNDCIPGASPLPLDLFSLEGDVPLGSGFSVEDWVWDEAEREGAGTLRGPGGGGAHLGIDGFAAVALVFPASVSFRVGCEGDGVTFTLTGVRLGIALRQELLPPAQNVGGEWMPVEGGGGDPPQVILRREEEVDLVVTYDGEGAPRISFGEGGGAGAGACGLAGLEFASDTPFLIASTGVVVRSARLFLQAAPGSRPPFSLRLCDVTLAFSGILSFLDDYAGAFQASGLAIERAGFSGAFTYPEAPGDPPCASPCNGATMFGREFCFRSLSLSFRQNAITGASICGGVEPPFFGPGAGHLDLELALQQDGRVRVALNPDRPRIVLRRDGIFELEVKGADFETWGEGGYRIRLDGELTLSFLENGLLGDSNSAITVPIRRMTFTSEGDVSLDGGWVRLPRPETFKFRDVFDVTIKAISFGRDDRLTWIGLDADIDLMDNLPIGGSLRGFRVLWDDRGRLSVEFGGIEIDFSQPGVVSFQGAVGWQGDDFRGRVRLHIEPIHFAVDATFVAGYDEIEEFRYFYVQLGTELPAGVPVFPGVSLYGLEGLFASNMRPNVDDVEVFPTPLVWYAEHHARPGGVSEDGTGPWIRQRGALSFGAGALIGSADDGFAVHAKATLLISIPGPLVSFEGRANILRKRGSLMSGGDPIFHAYAIYSPEFFEIGVGVNYELASVIKIRGDAEAKFNLQDASDWHVYLGNVSGQQIRATVVDFLQAQAFYMIHPEECDLRGSRIALDAGVPDLAFGAGIGFDEDYSVGPLGIALRALIEGWAAINFAPIHFQGGMDLDGAVELRAFGFSLGIATRADLAFQTPHPFILDGGFNVKLKLPWPLPDPEATVRLHWEKPSAPRPAFPVLKEVGLAARDGSGGILASESGASAPVVEIDFVPNLVFRRPVNDRTDAKNGRRDAGYLGARTDVCIADIVKREAGSTRPLSYAYYLRSVEMASRDADGGGAFDGTVAQPDGVWLPEVRKLPGDDCAVEGDELLETLPSRVLVLNDLNPFAHFASSDFIVEGDGDGGGGGLGGIARAGSKSLAQWIVDRECADCGCYPCQQTPGTPCRCPDQGWVPEEYPCVFLPYKVYRIEVVTQARRNPVAIVEGDERKTDCETGTPVMVGEDGKPLPDGEAGSEEWTQTFYFQTQGPPLDLTPYVHEALPGDAARPHFRSYHPAVRFNRNYIRQLYALPAGAEGVKVCEGEVGLCARILDSSRNLVSDCDETGVYFTEAEDHVEPLHDGSGVRGPDDLFEDVAGMVIKDDVLHIDCDPGRLRPGERHIVQIVWKDEDRLPEDRRFAIREPPYDQPPYLDPPENGEAILFEFPILASRYESLVDVFREFGEVGELACRGAHRGVYFHLEIPDGADWAAAADVLGELADIDGDAAPFAARLRDAYPDVAPTSVDDRALSVWLGRVERLVQCHDLESDEGCNEEDLVSGLDLEDVRDGWELERSAFERLDRILRLERYREPLPEEPEVSVLCRGGEWVGFLLELPEPLNFGRIAEVYCLLDGSDQGLRAVKDAAGARLLFFSFAGGEIRNLPGGEWMLGMYFRGWLRGSRTPALKRTGPLDAIPDAATMCFHLGLDAFGGDICR